MNPTRQNTDLLGEQDLHLFNEGTHTRLYEKLGALPGTLDGVNGTHFAVWAPNARSVSVVGDFNGWRHDVHLMTPVGSTGILQTFLPGVGKGARYRYSIESNYGGRQEKSDPFGRHHEVPPLKGSIVWDLDYEWGDAEWMTARRGRGTADAPMSIYEVHLGSWRRVPEDGNRSLSYREIAPALAEYVRSQGFTHVELMPVMEHPFYGSWGYQITGYFAPTSRYGTPQDLMFLIDHLHREGIGVILDWVPSHFPSDPTGLANFDGTHLFEHADPRQGLQPDWGSLLFNYGRNEVRAFLLSNAMFWLDKYHADALRVDAVASMLYLDYSRKAGEWIPNEFGGRENLQAISFLQRCNSDIGKAFPEVPTVAEESTSWPMVTRPVHLGGLGFGMKWDMGWMHDTLQYLSREPIHRKYHHGKLTFRMMYAFSENFVLPLSHDEVVHGKGSLIRKMPGDDRGKFANLRALYGWMHAMPGKKLLFMGGEFGQFSEWNHDASLDWHLLDRPLHAGLSRWTAALNRCHRDEPALHAGDFRPDGFEWVDCDDAENSVLALLRRAPDANPVLAVFNFSSEPRTNQRVGVPLDGVWREILNSDALEFGGGGAGNFGAVEAAPVPWHGRPSLLNLTLPPLSAIFLKPDDPRVVGSGAATGAADVEPTSR